MQITYPLYLTLCATLLFSPITCQAQTKLDLTATGTQTVLPDQMVADLNVQASAPKAATAQASVNHQMAQALAAAKAVAGMIATTGGYDIAQTEPQNAGDKPSYQASQSLELTIPAPGGLPPPAFLDLIGQLQQSGLLLNNLSGQLSPAGQDNARAAAMSDALHRLQAEAAAIAQNLDEKMGNIETLSVDGSNSQPPMPIPGRMMMAMASAPPVAAPGPVSVQVSVEATIALMPRAP